MIDLKHEAENFVPMDLGPDAENDKSDITWAYQLYNKSLGYIKKGFVEMARQNLKKALALNPDLYPARMLLGVCLFENGDRVGAMRTFNAIRDIKYKRLALSYYDYLSEEADRPAEESGKILILTKLYKEATGVSVSTKANSETKPERKTGPAPIKQEEDHIPIDDDGKIEVPKFIQERQKERQKQTIVYSHTNDGVVEEIVKQKREAAKNIARKTGEAQTPFKFNSVYNKKIFGEERKEETPNKKEETHERNAKDNMVISIASIIILVYMVIVSILLMQNMTENRRLKNNYADLQKQYEEAIITPTPKPYIPPTPSPEPVFEEYDAESGEAETETETETNENTDTTNS